jgi:peptidoglycan hydrolase CwlO-like protein
MNRPRHRFLTRLVLPLVAGLLVLAPAAGAAPKPTSKEEQSLRDLQSKRNQVRAEKAAKASKVDALKATDGEIEKALSDLSESVTAQTAALEEAERGVQQAQADVAAATQAEADTANQLAALKTSIKEQAIAAYVNVPGEEDWSLLSTEDPNDALNRRTLIEFQSNVNLDAAEDFRSLQEDLALQRQAKQEAQARAEYHKGQTKASLDQLAAAQAQQSQFQDAVEARIERELSEASSLAELDSSLSGQINQKQAAIAAALAAQRRKAETARAALSRGGRAPSAPSNVAIPAFTGSDSIVTVQGIRVHSSIAGRLDALLNAARAAGINFSGGGYRDPSGQIAVRQSNCGTSNYAIYQMPASSCSPPTARPGQSMHEKGLAIDFAAGGGTLSRGSAGFAWLQANAASYGFYNLPSEPWHWSTNGN